MLRSILILVSAGILLQAQNTFAIGALYAHPPLSNTNSFPLWLKKYDAQVTITDQIAVTHVDQTFKNETNQRLEGIFIFPLPGNAIITELILWINGKPVQAKVMESDTAKKIFENTIKKMLDPALLESMGDNIFKLSIFPIEASGSEMSERRIEITYAELLPYDCSAIDYRFFMQTVNLSPKPVERASIVIRVTSQKDILSLYSPTHGPTSGIVINKVSDKEYAVTFGEENAQAQKDLKIVYTLKNYNFAINHLTYTPNTDSAAFFDSTGDDSYYLLWITPPDELTQSKIIKKNIVFVADNSSSMEGERIKQVKNSLNAMVKALNPGDLFSIVTFNTGTNKFSPDLCAADEINKSKAKQFIDELGAVGMTNMEEAFTVSLANTWDDTSMNTIVFLTDGLPTWPIGTDMNKIVDTVSKYNKNSVAIFTFGIGEEVKESFLKIISDRNNGICRMIMKDDSIQLIMTSFMKKISFPLIRSISIDNGGLDKYDMYPKIVPNVYAGSQVTVLGRYRNTGSFTTTFSGLAGKESISLTRQLSFPSTMPNHPFVARMWASEKIDYLLDEIKKAGEQKELVTAVKRLGIKYGIITPYTSMLVVEPTKIVLDKTRPPATEVTLFESPMNGLPHNRLIQFSVPKTSRAQPVELKIFDLRGKVIKVLLNELTMGGHYNVVWDGTDQTGAKVSSGFYVVLLKVGAVTKMVSIRLLR